jgi:hypothetical protein
MKAIKSLKIIVAFISLSLAHSASATLFTFDENPSQGGGNLGSELVSINSTFNDVTQLFTWDAAFASDKIKSFWLVVNNGENPKKADVNELAIMFGDLATGRLSTYVYNGLNSATSWNNPGILIDTNTSSLTSTTNSFSISLDTTNINAYGYDPVPANESNGIAFDSKIGLWFHFSDQAINFNSNGGIESYYVGNQGWRDAANLTTSVPAPGALVLLGFGILAMRLSRKK